jgi:hypothetical protein
VMSNNMGFFSDPKVVISLLALVVSIVGLIWTLANQWDQNRRWESINAPNIVLREARMLPREKLTAANAKARNWGYDPEIFGSELNDEFHLLTAFRLNVINGQSLVSVRQFSTIEEAEANYKRLGSDNRATIDKILRPHLQFENIGKTTARAVNIAVDVLEAIGAKKEWRRAFDANSRPNVGPGQQTSVHFDIGLPVPAKIDSLAFKISQKFKDDNGAEFSSETEISWDAQNNYWHYSPAGARKVQ